jgi:hypothetical protein
MRSTKIPFKAKLDLFVQIANKLEGTLFDLAELLPR